MDSCSIYASLRKLGPVVYLPKNDLYALPRYAEVSNAQITLCCSRSKTRRLLMDI